MRAETRDDAVYYSEFSEYEQCRACHLVFFKEEGFLRKIHENRYESNEFRETKRAKKSWAIAMKDGDEGSGNYEDEFDKQKKLSVRSP